MNDLKLFSQIVDAVYGTALDDSRWGDVFRLMQEATGVEHFILQGFDHRLSTPAIAAMQGYDDSFVEDYSAHFWERNPWLPGIASAPLGKAVSAEDFCPEGTLRKSEFYNDLIRGHDDVGTGGGIVVFRDDERFLSVGGNIAFNHRDAVQRRWLDLLDLLSPHLRNAFELRRKLSAVSMVDQAYLQALGVIANPVFLLTDRGRVSYSNPAAEQLVRSGRFLFLDSAGVLRAHDKAAAKALGKGFFQIGHGGAHLEPLTRLLLRSKDGAHRTFATLAPFAPDPATIDVLSDFAADARPVALLTIAEPSGPDEPFGQAAAEAHSLTPAETALALALCRGLTLAAAAAERGVSINTARNQLKSIFEKVGVNSQAQLVAALHRLR